NGEFKVTGGSSGNAPTWSVSGEFDLVTVTIKVEEKPWGQGWLDPEDSGGNWYVLWSCDEHRFIVEVDNASPDEIQIVTINSFGNAVYQNGKWIHNITQWTANPISVTATVTMDTGKTITSSPIGVSKHSVSVEWEGSDHCQKIPSTTFGFLYLSKLTSGNDRWVAYQVPTVSNPFYNQVRAKITISPEIPQGRKGTVHFEWYDPNDFASQQGVGPNPGAIRDNTSKGTLSFLNGKTFTFDDAHRQGTTTPHIGKKVIEFPNDCFSANFVVTIHPRQGVEQLYDFDTNTHKKLQYNGQQLQGLSTSEMIVLSWWGFEVQETVYCGVANGWVFDKQQYTMRTPLPTNPANNSDSDANNNKSPISLLDYDCNFSMTVDFDYVGNDYVNAENPKNPHRSFHRNSGVKIYNLYEIQIYDTASLLAVSPLETMTNGVPKTNWQSQQIPSNGIKKTGDTAFESISGCVTGIPYLANTWHGKTQNDLAGGVGRKSLNFTFTRTLNNEENIVANIVSSNESFPNLIYGTGGQYKTKLNNVTNRKLYIQNHWGSGVSFKTITINAQ
ncbi:MAG: hypothetical protein LBE12_18975, partial [Planctomycetaceae bacterium]|nr:hypothetical protein [Planctomycetaceae bacterium]